MHHRFLITVDIHPELTTLSLFLVKIHFITAYHHNLNILPCLSRSLLNNSPFCTILCLGLVPQHPAATALLTPIMAPLANLVRLLPLHINELPAHPALESLLSAASDHTQSAGSSPSQPGKVEPSEKPNLISFIEEILDQATIFVDDTLPGTFKEGGLKTSAPATAKVRLLSRNISRAEIQAIPWINSGMYTLKHMLA